VPFSKEGKKFSSELRDDPKPSAMISQRGEKLRYIDFGYSEHRFDSISYVQYKFNLGFMDVLKLIDHDFALGLGKGTVQMKKRFVESRPKQVPKIKTVIQIKARPLTRLDMEFWGQYHITKETLSMYHVVPISYFWINGQRFKADLLAYAYCEYGNRIKIYQPLSDRKWFSNVNTHDIQGLYELPVMGSKVILTSSLKDVMALSESTIHACALQSEMMMPHPKAIKLLQRKFKEVVVLYDNDYDKDKNPGQTMALKICEKYNLRNIVIPERFQSKDPSDLILTHGPYVAYNLFK